MNNKSLSFRPRRCALVAALVAQAFLSAAFAEDMGAGDTLSWQAGTVAEDGTIPAARPGLPALNAGAQGPMRSESRMKTYTDPSIRPFAGAPDISHGMWETRPGNQVTQPDMNSDLRTLSASAE